jgi:hypothetical protein
MGDSYYPAAYGGGQLDFSGITQAAKGIAGGLSDLWDKKSVRNAWEASGGDYNEAIKRLVAAGDTEGAAEVAKIQRVVEGDQNSRFGLQPIWDQEGNAHVLNSGTGQATRLNGNFPPRMNYVQTPGAVYPMPVQGGMPQQPQTGGTNHPVYGSQEEADAAGAPQVDQGMQAPQYGQPIPKDYTLPEQQKMQGDLRGKAIEAMPAVTSATNRVIGTINSIEKDPGLSGALGPVWSRLPTVRDATADVEAKIKQAVGGTFLTAYETLRGAQAITDVEGDKATFAFNRLGQLTQSDPGYRRALSDAKYTAIDVLNSARARAGLPPVENKYPKPDGYDDWLGGEGATTASGGTGNRTSKGIQWSIEP